MGTFLRAQTIIPTASGVSANQVVWTMHFANADVSANRDQDAQEIQARISTLLTLLSPGTLNSEYVFSSSIVTSGAFLNVFDLAEAKPRVPFHTHPYSALTNVVSSGQDLPPEVSLCVSYQGDRVSGKPQNRRRGRLYVGPLQFANGIASDQLTPGTGGVDALLTHVKTALQPGTVGKTLFAVLSRSNWAGMAKGETPPPDPNTGEIIWPEIPANLSGAMVPVTSWWCDNAWDTQRRRGAKATYRKTL